MCIRDREKNEHYIPYVVEPSLGADRVTLAFLVDAYDEEVVDAEKNDVRTVLRLHPALAPFKCAVLPLSKKPVSYTHLMSILQNRFPLITSWVRCQFPGPKTWSRIRISTRASL